MGKAAVAMAAVCLVALLSLMAAGPVNGQCGMAQMSNCMGAVTSGQNPSPQCCAQVGAITNFDCFCNMMMNQGSRVPPAYIEHGRLIPSKCGAQGQFLRGKQCGNVYIP